MNSYLKLIRSFFSEREGLDIYSSGEEEPTQNLLLKYDLIKSGVSLKDYFSASLLILVVTFIFSLLSKQIGYQTVSLLFLFIITILPLLNYGRGPILLAAALSGFCWDFFFIPPRFTFLIAKVEDILVLILYLIVAMVSGLLISKIRKQQLFLLEKEKRTLSLYNLTRNLSAAKNLDDISEIAVNQISYAFNYQTILIFKSSGTKLDQEPHPASSFSINATEWHIAQWVLLNGIRAGRFTDTLSSSIATYFPLNSKSGQLGVVGFKLNGTDSIGLDQENILTAFVTQISNAVEREHLNRIAQESLLITESEKLFKTLFNSISHELKTPITAILSAVSSLNDDKIMNNRSVLTSLLDEINIASERLKRLVENLLDMTRLESGNIKPKINWHSISDLLNSVMERLKFESARHKIILTIDQEIPIFKFDFGLLEQALVNILHNSFEYTGAGSTVEVSVSQIDQNCLIQIIDNGKGFPEAALEKLFGKFYRVPGTKAGGTGLGLSIAKGFIEAHKGSIRVANAKSGGAHFQIMIPLLTEE